MDDRFAALAELAVHGANVQHGQIVAVGAMVGQEALAREVAGAAYRRGAVFVDVTYFDPRVKRARIENADPDTLGFVPPWYGARLETIAERGDCRISLSGVADPAPFAGLDPALVGRDALPALKESAKVVNDRATNWTIVPCPHPEWAKVVFPDLPEDEAFERLWSELWTILRLDEPDPGAAWDERTAALKRSAAALDERRFDRLELVGPGTELTVGLLPSSDWWAGDFTTRTGVRHLPNLPTEEVFATPDPLRTEGHVTSTRPLVLKDGTTIRGLRVRFEEGRAVEIDADENGPALRSQADKDEGATRLGEVALVDRRGRIGPLGTVFYDTLLDENAASHIALGDGSDEGLSEEDSARRNRSSIHIDFMIGGDDVAVTGITREGDRVPVLRDGGWEL